MRFACDRCKTRYSIADERVRGKILKIRCKACANVITVREGMDAPPEQEPERVHRPTTLAPAATVGSGGVAPPAPALTAAFSSAMSAPASKLEDEWYLSRDGDQHGPFDLQSAKAWVSQHPYDAELHCWCEGFDDWLPVERIGHFRNLRPRPAPPPVPATPEQRSVAPVAMAPAHAAPADPQAAARAASGALPSLRERAAPTGPLGPAAREPSLSLASAEPKRAVPASQGRMGSGPVATVIGAPPIPAQSPAQLPQAASRPAAVAAPAASAPPLSAASSSGGFSLDDKPRFAASLAALDPGSGASAATRIEPAMAMEPAHAPAATPRGAFDAGDLGGEGFGPHASASGLRPAVAPSSFDDELEFGEVSRVVRIADLNKSAPRKPAAAAQSNGAGPAPAPAWTSPAPLAALAQGEPAAPAMRGDVPLVVPDAQHRNHALLLGLVAFGLVGAGVTAFVLVRGTSPEDPVLISTSNSDVRDLTIRPDDPRRPAAGSAAPEHTPSTPRTANPPRRPVATGTGATVPATPQTGKIEATPSTGPLTPLGGDEVEAMSQRNSSGLQRCYEQALKKDIFLDVKSIKVTISIAANGGVSNVAMSSHGDHALGQCMMARIRNWRFRPSTAGLDAKFTVAFGRT